jgi:hypothetical protein
MCVQTIKIICVFHKTYLLNRPRFLHYHMSAFKIELKI